MKTDYEPTADKFPGVFMDSLPPINTLARSYSELRERCIVLEKAVDKVARLNPEAGEIGAGMLAQIIEQSTNALNA